MATINLGNASPTEDIRQVDIKHTAIHIQPVQLDTPSLTPVATPEDASPAEELMAGKKIYSMERPEDKAKSLAAKLTLEEQVRGYYRFEKYWVFLLRQFWEGRSRGAIVLASVQWAAMPEACSCEQ